MRQLKVAVSTTARDDISLKIPDRCKETTTFNHIRRIKLRMNKLKDEFIPFLG